MRHEDPSKLYRQVERSSLFTHTALSRHSSRINEIESFLYAVIDILTQKGILTPEELAQAVELVRQELVEKEENSHPGLTLRGDEPGDDEFVPVNCQERLSICQAVCCKLDFALNAAEVESGEIKWDLGRPYFIRHETNCYCTHLDLERQGCTVYEHRPSVCKKYSCANDKRIWKDFDKMEMNYEWIEANLREVKPKFTGAPMFPGQILLQKLDTEETNNDSSTN